MNSIITDQQVQKRAKWIVKLKENCNPFSEAGGRIINSLREEIANEGYESILGHLRFCGVIPECYRHDSTEEKVYSKYTDSVIAEALAYMGLNTIVLDGRADMADIEAVSSDPFPFYDLVADAKAFRLSRTAKNQKDFKVPSMDRWRYSKRFAAVVAPIDQLPRRTSQIYLDASVRNVCVLSYSHLAALIQAKELIGSEFSIYLLERLLAQPGLMNPSKSASSYWRSINNMMLESHDKMEFIWKIEKLANLEALALLKREGMNFYSKERSEILQLSREQAIQKLLRYTRIDGKIEDISSFKSNNLLESI